MTALLHKLAVDAFQRASSAGGCLEVSVRYVPFNVQAADLKDSALERAKRDAASPFGALDRLVRASISRGVFPTATGSCSRSAARTARSGPRFARRLLGSLHKERSRPRTRHRHAPARKEANGVWARPASDGSTQVRTAARAAGVLRPRSARCAPRRCPSGDYFFECS
jgi:hypothetical protein